MWGNSPPEGGEFEALVSLQLVTVIFIYLVRTFRNLNMAPDPQWERPEVDDTWNAWYLECMVHGTWNACCMVPGMHGIWNAGCEAPRNS